MKINNIFLPGLVLAILSTSILSIACSKEETPLVAETPLTQADEASLLFILEEEKLARDVYTQLHELWGTNQFANIKESEQRHMNYVIELLDQYDVGYDLAAPGIFNNDDLQNLYDKLIATGTESKGKAFIVGATIEDVDIFDLKQGISDTSNQDIIPVYEKLLCGSKNHMRAFTKGLTNLGMTYTPQYISTTDYEQILEASNQHCG